VSHTLLANTQYSITDPTLIAHHVCAANKNQYNQAVHTLLGSRHLSETLGFDASYTAAEEFLQATIHPSPSQKHQIYSINFPNL
jgi:hypothetical protein